jgi:hypothetical protein
MLAATMAVVTTCVEPVIFFVVLRSRCIFRLPSTLQSSEQYLTSILVVENTFPQFAQVQSRRLFSAAWRQ